MDELPDARAVLGAELFFRGVVLQREPVQHHGHVLLDDVGNAAREERDHFHGHPVDGLPLEDEPEDVADLDQLVHSVREGIHGPPVLDRHNLREHKREVDEARLKPAEMVVVALYGAFVAVDQKLLQLHDHIDLLKPVEPLRNLRHPTLRLCALPVQLHGESFALVAEGMVEAGHPLVELVDDSDDLIVGVSHGVSDELLEDPAKAVSNAAVKFVLEILVESRPLISVHALDAVDDRELNIVHVEAVLGVIALHRALPRSCLPADFVQYGVLA